MDNDNVIDCHCNFPSNVSFFLFDIYVKSVSSPVTRGTGTSLSSPEEPSLVVV